MRQAEAFITTRSEAETAHIGEVLGRILDRPLVVALQGELGAGKTVFVRGAARGLAVREQITSPTFVLQRIYHGRLPLYHFDFYRLSDDDDIIELGFEEYLPGEGAAFVEWPERLPEVLPPDQLEIIIERFYDGNGEGRQLRFNPLGSTSAAILALLLETLNWHSDGSLNIT
ncbi:MAG: tRNA (adenosine(37)-N6)-threonylcarbamoyltransferase complex ATPase subunit type 1 TsaE [Bacillota bacterium]|nr:tRNA (adenosine(37)-N6)-threonylcarbamoyltransferase complex ATPase subunit type 1 TsaE [Bacillota bacterium]